MIKANRVLKFTAPDGALFDTFDAAQKHAVQCLMCGDKIPSDNESKAIEWIIASRSKLVDILKQQPRKNASPATAKVRKPRKARTESPEPAAP